MKSFALLFLGLSLALASMTPATANTASSVADSAPDRREIFTAVAPSLRSVDAVLIAASIAGASRDALIAVRKDLLARAPSGDLGEASIKNDEIFVNGAATGVQFVSYAPLKIRFRHRFWSPEVNVPLDRNATSLARFLESTKTTSALDLLLPRASAAEPTTSVVEGAMNGASEGAASGGRLLANLTATVMGVALVAAVATGPVSWPVIAGAFLTRIAGAYVLGAAAGAFNGALDGEKKALEAQKENKPVDLLKTRDFLMKCDGNEVRISSGKSIQDKTQIVVRRFPKEGEERLAVLKADGSPANLSLLTAENKKLISENLLGCKNQAQADEITKKANEATQLVASLTQKGETAPGTNATRSVQ